MIDGNKGKSADGYAVYNAAIQRSAAYIEKMVLTDCRIRSSDFQGTTPEADASAVYTSPKGAAKIPPPANLEIGQTRVTGNEGHGVRGYVLSNGDNVISNSSTTSEGWVNSDEVS